MNTEQQKGEMSFLEHLEVFRWHLVRSAFAILFFSILAFVFKGIVFDTILLAPKNPDFPTYLALCNRFHQCIGRRPKPVWQIDVVVIGRGFLRRLNINFNIIF